MNRKWKIPAAIVSAVTVCTLSAQVSGDMLKSPGIPNAASGYQTSRVVLTCNEPGEEPVAGLPKCQTVDDLLIVSLENPGEMTGTFQGTQVVYGNLLTFDDGRANFTGILYFKGTVPSCYGSKKGTVVFIVDGFTDPSGTVIFSHHRTVPGGTLAVHADLYIANDGTITGTYVC